MKSLKLNLDINMVNCVLLLVVLIIVLLCCYNKEQFQQAIRLPNCNKLHPCVMDTRKDSDTYGKIGVNHLSGMNLGDQNRKPEMLRCQSDMFKWPEEIYKNANGRINMKEAEERSCRATEERRRKNGSFSPFCNIRKIYNDDIWNPYNNQASGQSVENTKDIANIVTECNIQYDSNYKDGKAKSGSMCRIPRNQGINCGKNIVERSINDKMRDYLKQIDGVRTPESTPPPLPDLANIPGSAAPLLPPTFNKQNNTREVYDTPPMPGFVQSNRPPRRNRQNRRNRRNRQRIRRPPNIMMA